MRRLLHLLIVSVMISGMLFFGAASAFAQDLGDLEQILKDAGLSEDQIDTILEEVESLIGGEGDDPTGGLLPEEDLLGLCSLLEELGLAELVAGLCVVRPPPPPTTPPPAAPIQQPVAAAAESPQVSNVPSGGVATGGGSVPVGATALIGTLLAIAALGTGLGRALARS